VVDSAGEAYLFSEIDEAMGFSTNLQGTLFGI